MSGNGWAPHAPWLKAALDWRDGALPGGGRRKRKVPCEPPAAVREGLAAEGLYNPMALTARPKPLTGKNVSARHAMRARRWAARIDAYLALVVRRETLADRKDRARAERVRYEWDRPLPPPPGRYRVIRLIHVRFAARLVSRRRRTRTGRSFELREWSA